MNKTSSILIAGLVVAMTGCMKKSPSGASPAGGGTAPSADTAPFAGTMADAPVHHLGASIKAAAGCSESGYAKFDFPVGQAVKMDVTVEGPAGACLSVSYLKANGGNVDGMMKELCIDKNAKETWDIQGLEGGSFLQVLEQPPCKGAGISIATQ